MTAWLVRHLQTSIGSLGRLAQHKLATTLTILVIGIALALPACLHLLVTNAQTATGNWNRAVDLTVFLKRPTSAEEARRTAERIRQRRDVAEAQLILADEALKEFRRDSGFGEAIDALNENPLPHTIVVRPAPTYTNTANLAEPRRGRPGAALGRSRAARHCMGQPAERHPGGVSARPARWLRPCSGSG